MKTTTTTLLDEVLPEFDVEVFSGWLRRDFLRKIARPTPHRRVSALRYAPPPPPPAVPIDPVIEISGAVAKPFRPATGRAPMLPRRQLTAQGYRPLGQLRSVVLSEWRRP